MEGTLVGGFVLPGPFLSVIGFLAGGVVGFFGVGFGAGFFPLFINLSLLTLNDLYHSDKIKAMENEYG